MLAGQANYFIDAGYAVSIITYDGSTQSCFNMHTAVTITTLPVTFIHHSKMPLKQLWHFIKDVGRYKSVKDVVAKADYCITTDQIIATVFFYSFKKLINKLVVWEHLSYINYNTSRVWKYFVEKVYPKVKMVVTLNNEEAGHYATMGCTVQSIPNAIVKNDKAVLVTTGHLVWVGAITKEKGIEALPALTELFKQHGLQNTIQVYGKGDSEEYLKEAIKAKGLSDILIYEGLENDTSMIYKDAMALLVTSKHECLPTVILEAFSYGLPVIAFDCPTGPRNMIADKTDGRIIPMDDVHALYNCISDLVSDSQLLQSMGDAAYAAADNYAPEVVYTKWKNILA